MDKNQSVGGCLKLPILQIVEALEALAGDVMLGQNNAMMGQNMANAGPIDYRAMYPFVMPAAMESDFSAEEMAEDMDGMTMAFQRVKIPGGGTLQFEMPSDDPDRPEYSTSLVGVILYNHASHAYWAGDSSEEENNPPVCSSLDGKTGIGIPGGACAACQLNKFRTASKGKGKACKNMRVLYLLRSGDYMPLQLNLPPTSIKAFQDFMREIGMPTTISELGGKAEDIPGMVENMFYGAPNHGNYVKLTPEIAAEIYQMAL